MAMGNAHLDRKFTSGITGASDRLASFDAAIELAKKKSINYIFIAGNLFDSPNPSEEVLKHVYNSLAGLTARVIITPGSCDPSTINSCYKSFAFPKNVFIFPSSEMNYIEFGDRFRGAIDREYLFSGGRETGRKGVRIYGAAFESHFKKESLLLTSDGNTPRISSSYINVLVMHGFVTQEMRGSFNPIPQDVLKSCGFDLCVIGGETSCRRKGSLIVPGTLCPSRFSDEGDCGVYIGEVSDGGLLTSDYVSVAPYKYETITFDVTGRDDISPDALAADILKLSNTANCTRIELTGELLFDENIDVDVLGDILNPKFPLVEVCDKTMKRADLSIFNNEKTLRGMFTSSIWESVKASREISRKAGTVNHNEKNYESAVNLGLKIIDDMSVKGTYSSLGRKITPEEAQKAEERRKGAFEFSFDIGGSKEESPEGGASFE